jgi:hypothetical protein
LQKFRVKKSGEGLKTQYTLIPLLWDLKSFAPLIFRGFHTHFFCERSLIIKGFLPEGARF